MAAATSSLLILIILAAVASRASASWCVCKDGLSNADMQKTLDYACGAGADCNPIHSSGACYNPNTLKSHCSYAVNSYYQRKGSSGATCDFSGTAYIVSSDPSVSGCTFPASSGAAGTTTTPSTNVPSSTTPPTRTPTTTLPYNTTPTNGGLGGISTGLGPSGTNTDFSGATPVLLNSISLSFLVTTSGLVMLLWGCGIQEM
uniref:X8 domain-containing protein n=1 Tax=Kalanchoe fedtschenkoi TaxID=63787 RepID=A0A7N0T1P1_KALFE